MDIHGEEKIIVSMLPFFIHKKGFVLVGFGPQWLVIVGANILHLSIYLFLAIPDPFYGETWDLNLTDHGHSGVGSLFSYIEQNGTPEESVFLFFLLQFNVLQLVCHCTLEEGQQLHLLCVEIGKYRFGFLLHPQQSAIPFLDFSHCENMDWEHISNLYIHFRLIHTFVFIPRR